MDRTKRRRRNRRKLDTEEKNKRIERVEGQVRKLASGPTKKSGGQPRSAKYYLHHNFNYSEPKAYKEPRKEPEPSYTKNEPEHLQEFTSPKPKLDLKALIEQKLREHF